jgi:oligopeptidase B
MRLMKAPVKPNSEAEWKDVTLAKSDEKLFDGSYERCLDGIETFKTHIVAQGREGGIPRVWIMALNEDDEDNRDGNAAVRRRSA